MEAHAEQKQSMARGFFWLSASYIASTAFFIASKYSLNHVAVLDFLMLWYISGFVFNLTYNVIRGKESLRNFKIVLTRVKALLVVFIVMDIVATFSGFTALSMVDPSISSFMNQSQILFTMVLAFFILNERFDRFELGASFVIILGVVVMTFRSTRVPAAATGLLIISNFAQSMNLILIRKIAGGVGTFIFALIRATSLSLFYTTYNLTQTDGITLPPLAVVLVLMGGAFFGPFLNVLTMYKVLDYIPAGKTVLLRSVTPFFVLVAGSVFLGTFPGIREIVGGVIIICGSFLLAYLHSRHVIEWKIPFRRPR